MLPFRNLGSNSVIRRFGLKIRGSGKVEGFLFGNTGLGPGLHGMGGNIGEHRVNVRRCWDGESRGGGFWRY